nr:hypothetical protein [Tanacetum cinerariifolium]
MSTVLTSIDAAIVLASRAAEVPTGSGSIPTAGPSATKEYHQFASELPIERRIELISDLVKYQDNYAKIYKFLSQQRKPSTKKQKRDYYMAVIRSNLGWKVKDFRGMMFEEVEAKFNSVWKQIEDFIPTCSKEEAERIKRKGLSLEQESAKKFKPLEEVTEEAKSPDKVPEEKIKEMMQLVPIEEMYVEALQVKHPIIDWKHLDREGLNQLWSLVKETLSNRPPTSDKEMELWVELSRLYEPDDEDQMWTHTQNLMHAPVEWKLYDSCRVHHVTAKDKEIFMLVEKDYPLRKAEGSETLEQTFNRLQVIVGQLQFMDVEIEQDDLNQKFLTNDLYNHLKVYESKVKKKLEPNSQKMAFISLAKHSSGNEDGNTASVSTASTNVPTACANIGVASISQDTACAYIAFQSSSSQIKFEDINQIDEDDMEEIDIKWSMALLSMRADKL